MKICRAQHKMCDGGLKNQQFDFFPNAFLPPSIGKTLKTVAMSFQEVVLT